MGLEEADVEKERLRWAAIQISDRCRRHVRGTIALRLEKFVVPDALRFIGNVLQAAEHRLVTGVAERVEHMLAVIVQREAAVRQAEHPVLVRELAGEQRRPAWRARRRATERAPEQDAFRSEALQIRGRHGVAVRLEVAARIVRVDVQDVRRAAGRRLRAGGRKCRGGRDVTEESSSGWHDPTTLIEG